jgi:aspartyl-tRNA(Asn)/glutamyl-tRNA(Gln) amidotransferase subunit A
MPVRPALLKQTQLFNVTGHPAITIPVKTQGLPVGLQLVGRRGATPDLLALALTIEGVLNA